MDAYEERREWRRRLEAVLNPVKVKLGLVWSLSGGVSVIWYWGKDETGFASGATPEAAADSVLRQIFGGL